MWRVILSLCLLLAALAAADPLRFQPQGGTVKNIICPDKQGTCPDGSTCCQLQSGKYGCCPLPQGVCCKGSAFCCPRDSTCSDNGCVSNKDGRRLPWLRTSSASSTSPTNAKNQPKQSVVSPSRGTRKLQPTSGSKRLVCPGGKTFCESGRTCCYQDNGHFGCCSYVNGTCCADRKHCCPMGFTCDIKLEKCMKGGALSLPLGETHDSKANEPEPEEQIKSVTYVVCPDGASQCADGSTCCLMLSGEYGCCPLPDAVCCSDHLHCCPQGSTCDVAAGTCLQSNGQSVPWVEKQSAAVTPVSGVACADNKTTCDDGTTCCQMLDGYYGCCPFSDAICCKDKLHCCPKTQKCDIKRGECISADGITSSPWAEKVPGRPKKMLPSEMVRLSEIMAVSDVICPDKKSKCATGTTCCQIASGTYGCCPMPEAVCCSDQIHCCPHGYTCNVARGTCSASNGNTIQWKEKLSSQPIVKDTVCPDKKSYCPGHTTCCKQKSGQYGCCPLPEATCCSDGYHCCPNGYKCDLKISSCVKASTKDITIPWSEKIPARQLPGTSDVGWVVCPDKKSQCQDSYTCCKLVSGQFGCCPMPSAVCCKDGLHCCPSGMQCDQGMCQATSNSLRLSWSRVRSGLPISESSPSEAINEQCPDKTECPQGTTCCQMKSGKYGCCPYSKGSCCKDKIHCCPAGYKCDATGTRCDKAGDTSLSMSSTMFTRNKPRPVTNGVTATGSVICPDHAECPTGNTCCKNSAGGYGCCPFDSAVCCADGVHCCPQGFACDPQSGTCTQAGVPWVTKVPASPRLPAQAQGEEEEPVKSVTCDDTTSCSTGQTCCRRSSGDWACCPMEEAVCCSDGIHCCPHGDRCIVEAGMCVQDVTEQQTPAFLSAIPAAGSKKP